MEPEVEQTAQADSTDPMDALLDRVVGTDEGQTQQDPAQGEEQSQEQTQDAAESQQTETQAELEEVEWEGEKYQLPPKLKSALMRQQDYTQKTQEIAEARRMVELEKQQRQLEQLFQQSTSQEQATLAELEAAIKQYNSVDWQQLDTDSLVKTRHALDMLKDRRNEVQKKIEGKRGEFEGKMRETHQKSLQQANEYLTKAIPKWGVEVQKELMTYGQAEGYTDVELGSIRDPRIIKSLWKAQQWDRLQAAKPLTAKRAAGVPPVVRPGATKGVASLDVQKADTLKQLHQAKDPAKKKELFDKALDLKLSRMF